MIGRYLNAPPAALAIAALLSIGTAAADDAHHNLHRNAKCRLVTRENVEDALGVAVDPPRGEIMMVFTGTPDSFNASTCTFRWHGVASGKSEHRLYVRLELPPFLPGNWPENLRRMFMETGDSSRPVSGLGDFALWSSRRGHLPYGELDVWRTGQLRLIVWEEDLPDDAQAMKVTESLAAIALKNL